MTSLTTSDAQIAPHPPPARRVAGGTRPSASLRLLRDVPASPRRRASRLASSRPQRGPLWISSQPLSRVDGEGSVSMKFEIASDEGLPIRGDIDAPPEARALVMVVHGFKGFKGWGFFPWVAETL